MKRNLLPAQLVYASRPVSRMMGTVPIVLRFEADFVEQCEPDAFDAFLDRVFYMLKVAEIDFVGPGKRVEVYIELTVTAETDVESDMCTLASMIEAEFQMPVESSSVDITIDWQAITSRNA